MILGMCFIWECTNVARGIYGSISYSLAMCTYSELMTICLAFFS